LTCTATSTGGTSSKSVTIKRDATPPTIAFGSLTPGANANGWNNTDVVVSFNGSDTLSGITSCSTPVTLSSEGAGQSAAGTCADKAGNVSALATASGINIDKTVPTLISSVSPNPALLNGSATASTGATDSLSGIASQGCGALDTSNVGSKTVTCTATDNAGNTASQAVAYSVQYASAGTCYGAPGHAILQPINADGSSVFKWKSTVPAKFRVCDATGYSIGTPGVVSSFKLIQKAAGTATDVDEAVDSTTPDAAFRWDSTSQQWIFNMSTKSLSASLTYYYRITLNDGTNIDFKLGLK